MNFDQVHTHLLEVLEESGEIYKAMESGDSIEMIRAADRVISRHSLFTEILNTDKKSSETSKEFRILGNSSYDSGYIRAALAFYNIAIAHAIPRTPEMLLAVSNRSAVLFTIKSLTCILDIKKCLTMNCPPNLAKKLNRRMLEAQAFTGAEMILGMSYINQFISTFFTTEFKRHKDVTCASSDIAFSTNDGVRQITAKSKISPGNIVAIEPAFITCCYDEDRYLSCYSCNRLLLNPSPCPKCCYAMFCSDECRNLCMNDYHSIECQIMGLLVQRIYSDHKKKLTIRAVIKLSLKLGWDRFIGASEDIGSSRMKTASTKEMYSTEGPLSMLCYDDNQELVEGRMFNGSINCAIVLKSLDKLANYFPKETAKRAAAKKAMSKIMFHLYVHFTNTVEFSSFSYDYKSDCYKEDQMFKGWFSMSSKLKHSCQPNLLVVGLNNQIALLTLRTIEKGEELTISFIEHFLDYDDLRRNSIPNFRAMQLFMGTKKICSCNVCTEDWCHGDLKYEPMTDRQADLNRRFQSVANITKRFNKSSLHLVCEMLDTFSIKSRQYHEAFKTLKQFLCFSQCQLTDNRCYSAY